MFRVFFFQKSIANRISEWWRVCLYHLISKFLQSFVSTPDDLALCGILAHLSACFISEAQRAKGWRKCQEVGGLLKAFHLGLPTPLLDCCLLFSSLCLDVNTPDQRGGEGALTWFSPNECLFNIYVWLISVLSLRRCKWKIIWDCTEKQYVMSFMSLSFVWKWGCRTISLQHVY